MIPTAIPCWLLPSIILLPALLWMFLGVGLPWALAVLPRSDWRDYLTVIAVALALGPAFVTTAMFVIGTFGQLTVANVLGVSALVAGIGLALAARNPVTSQSKLVPQPVVTLIDVVLLLAVFVVLILRFWNAAYWPYTTYDEFWVYGYNAKLFMLHGSIPASVGYYPQLIPLTYTYGQLLWGGVNDHAARTVVPIFALASALMAYVLGRRLFNRRVGLLTTAIWMLYPHNSAWSQFGDLEVPLTLYFTGTAAFFALGWREQNRRYIVLSGLLMGAALWTKPTAGALVESVGLVMVVVAVRWLLGAKRYDLRQLLMSKAARYPLLAVSVAIPMGAMWYVRNVLFGHPPIIFPASYWQQQAQRSGQELGWLLVIAAVGTVVLTLRRQRAGIAVAGFLMLAAGTLPSAFGWRIPTVDEWSQLLLGSVVPSIKPTRLGVIEVSLILLGMVLLAWAWLPCWRSFPTQRRHTVLLVGTFVAPYFVTWFWSYSYHFRLSFAVVPLLIVLLATLLDTWLSALITTPDRPLRIATISAVVLVLALPGCLAMLAALQPAITGTLLDDHAKMARGNPALIALVDYLKDRRDPAHRPLALDRPLRVEAPGELRLPFFFPLDDIRAERYPMFLDQIVGVDYFVDSSVGQRLYIENGKQYNQILSSLTRNDVMQRLYTVDDGNFRFSAYDVDNVARFKNPSPNGLLNVQVGDFAQLIGGDLSTLRSAPGQSVYLTLWWKALKPADLDYSVYIHFWDPRTQLLVGQWGGEPVSGAWSVWEGVPGAHFSVAYHTRLWQAGETIRDEWKLNVPEAQPGAYEFRLGLFDPSTGERLPVIKDGIVIGDGVRLPDFTILPK
jgi:4-amino-4-deoxy-L-arabinose transferase-like glycosyltransferase